MFKYITHLSMTAAVLAAVPAVASAQAVSYGVAPISVTSCATSDETGFIAPVSLGGLVALQSSNDVALSYVNTSNIAATSVTFRVNDGNQTSSLTAKGSFAPNVTISRDFSANATGANGPAACTVSEVQFADGSVWQAHPLLVGSR